jgi:hypothetical protein
MGQEIAAAPADFSHGSGRLTRAGGASGSTSSRSRWPWWVKNPRPKRAAARSTRCLQQRGLRRDLQQRRLLPSFGRREPRGRRDHLIAGETFRQHSTTAMRPTLPVSQAMQRYARFPLDVLPRQALASHLRLRNGAGSGGYRVIQFTLVIIRLRFCFADTTRMQPPAPAAGAPQT